MSERYKPKVGDDVFVIHMFGGPPRRGQIFGEVNQDAQGLSWVKVRLTGGNIEPCNLAFVFSWSKVEEYDLQVQRYKALQNDAQQLMMRTLNSLRMV